MLLIIRNAHELDYGQLMEVYEQSNRECGTTHYPRCGAAEQQLRAEQDFYDYLCSILTDGCSVCAVWAPERRYKAALRLEPYRDGLIVTALETAPAERGKGYAEMLLKSVLHEFSHVRIYSHIDRKNAVSIRIHEKCGFRHLLDHAVYLDGSVSSRAYTYIRE